MASRAERRKARKRQKDRMKDVVADLGRKPAEPISEAAVSVCERPTDERKLRGKWHVPKGSDRRTRPMIDMESDEIARLYVSKKITHAQEQSARSFQQIRANYLKELPDITGYKSCLSGSVPGYDDGDGNPVVIATYRSIEAKLSLPERRELLRVADSNEKCRHIDLLQSALDVVGGVDARRKKRY